MNAKQIKHYEILSEFFNSDILKQAAVDKYFGALLKLDYAYAEDLWEFMLIRSDADLKNVLSDYFWSDLTGKEAKA